MKRVGGFLHKNGVCVEKIDALVWYDGSMGAGHDHSGHHHHHGAQGRAFAWGIGLNLAFVAAETTAGLLANSVSLLADAGHNFGDVLALAFAWGAHQLSHAKAQGRYTFGYKRATILAPALNSTLILLISGGLAWESFNRLMHPEPVQTNLVMWVAGLGIVINSLTAYFFWGEKDHDINSRGDYLHMATDALVSLGVVISGFVLKWTGLLWVDPAVSLAIVGVIAWSSFGLLRDSTALLMGAAPEKVSLDDLRKKILSVPGVSAIHDLHVWSLSSTEPAMSVHVELIPNAPGDVLVVLSKQVRDEFGIVHTTIQIEASGQSATCLVHCE